MVCRDREYSLIGKTTILHIVILGSNPNISTKAREAQLGRAEHWRCLGYKFKSYFEQNRCAEIW